NERNNLAGKVAAEVQRLLPPKIRIERKVLIPGIPPRLTGFPPRPEGGSPPRIETIVDEVGNPLWTLGKADDLRRQLEAQLNGALTAAENAVRDTESRIMGLNNDFLRLAESAAKAETNRLAQLTIREEASRVLRRTRELEVKYREALLAPETIK